jgi:hypothetical protein
VKGSKQAPPNDPWSFSIGPRDCAGQALARIELQVGFDLMLKYSIVLFPCLHVILQQHEWKSLHKHLHYSQLCCS